MRLTQQEHEIFKDLAQTCFGAGSRIFLFGSRTDDQKKGGDIDLYIIPTSRGRLFENKIKFLTQVQLCIGEQKIDLILARDATRPIEQEALAHGIEL